jgi:hypothetical protein
VQPSENHSLQDPKDNSRCNQQRITNISIQQITEVQPSENTNSRIQGISVDAIIRKSLVKQRDLIDMSGYNHQGITNSRMSCNAIPREKNGRLEIQRVPDIES